MPQAPTLEWLPAIEDWRARIAGLKSDPAPAIETAIGLANTKLDFIRTSALDQVVRGHWSEAPAGLGTRPIKLAVLGSSTLAHLLPGIRVAGLRRSLWIESFEGEYGQYLQELSETDSPLHEFRPSAILFAFDAQHLCAGLTAGAVAADVDAALSEVRERILECWRRAREAFGCVILQQTVLPVHQTLIGGNEHRLAGSRAAFVSRLNVMLREIADAEGAELVALDDRAARDGLSAWHDPALWHRSKQEVAPAAGPIYGELVARLLAAKQGKSYKALVLDLDNTLWGGVIGDDGLEGIVIGQGSALGEGFLAVQDYAREQARRGIILAVCSKNDEANAVEAFDKHPEMLLRRGDIASFVANWSDKATNIRQIATELNIGLDSLVFLDDNPFERNLIRQELPMVAVPEVPDDPALVPGALADAGYFEALAITDEDRERGAQYQGNRQREALKASVTDMEGYLRGLEMRLIWRPFDRIGLQRTVQLINKTNQFNLTTRRYTEAEVEAVMADPSAVGLQLRLLDRFGDNGIIAIVIGRMVAGTEDFLVDTWLMSCRVLGRQVEEGTLNVLAAEGARLGARRMIGEYIPTKKNGMVRKHYEKLGFTTTHESPDGASRAMLDLLSFTPFPTFTVIERG
jgi:FkbH-like protein